LLKGFKVGRAWARGVKRRWRELKIRTVIEQKHGPDPLLGPEDRKQLAKLVEETPDATLEELRKQLETPASAATVCRALKQMKLTLKKKSVHASEQERPDVKREREDWEHSLPGLDLERLVFLDECGINTLMDRLYGRCLQGERLVDSAPAGRRQNNTLLSAVRLAGVIAPLLLPGPVNGDSFATYVEQLLVRELRRATL